MFGARGTVSSCGNGALTNAYSVHAAVTFLKALGEDLCGLEMPQTSLLT